MVAHTSGDPVRARHVVVATGFENAPVIPEWAGRERFAGTLIHAASYRNADPFRGEDVLVVGPGCSGMEIAYELTEDGAARVRLAVRTPPSLILRQLAGMPNDIPSRAILKLPTRLGDRQARLIERLAVGDLREYGLGRPEEGPITRFRRTGKTPAIVDREVVRAIKDRRIEIVAGVESLDESGVRLTDGSRIEPGAVIAATGYRRGLEEMMGHLGVLDAQGVPLVVGGREAAPGMRFIGFAPRPGVIEIVGREAKRAAKAIAADASAEVALG